MDFTDTTDIYKVDINSGWNQIGIPYSYPVDFNKMKFKPAGEPELTISDAIKNNKLTGAVYNYYSADRQGYVVSVLDSTIAKPWEGYWIYSAVNGELIFANEPMFEPKIIVTDTTFLKKRIHTDDWQINLTVENDKFIDKGNIFGIKTGDQLLPVYEPPRLQDYCSVSFAGEKGQLTFDLRQPFKSYDQVKEWDLYIQSSEVKQQHRISWPKSGEESSVYVYLVDPVKSGACILIY